MNYDLYNFDIFPKVLPCGKTSRVNIAFLGRYCPNDRDMHRVDVYFMDTRKNVYTEECPAYNGRISFGLAPEFEGEYSVTVCDANGNRVCKLSLYAVEKELQGRYPFKGDLHMHTCRSDGGERPASVAANYRRLGYDFTVISDHNRYYPSIEAIRAYSGVNIDLCIVQGEEIHLPGNDIHTVNFGGRYSVNGLVSGTPQTVEAGGDKSLYSIDGACPDPISAEEYTNQVNAIAREITDLPKELEEYRFTYASLVWIFQRVCEAQGLCIFAHPYWITDLFYHVPGALTEYILEKRPFHAFEVLGGENYYRQNGRQTAEYYSMRAKGVDLPVVGSTDSHGSTENNRNYNICSTVVLSPLNEREALVQSVKEKMSVAVDSISTEYRLVGDYRLTRYVTFLMECYFPLHDEICHREGVAMRRYAETGSEREKAVLEACHGSVDELIRKYFAV